MTNLYQMISLGPSKHPIALISQHTISEWFTGREFLTIHAKVRGALNINEVVEETIEFANKQTGEAIIKKPHDRLSVPDEVSSDCCAVVIGNSPIILLDEIENAGIHKQKHWSSWKNTQSYLFRNTRSQLLLFFLIAELINEKRCNAENCLFKT